MKKGVGGRTRYVRRQQRLSRGCVDSGGKGYNSTSGYYTFAASGRRLVEWVFRLGQLTPNGGELEQRTPVSIGQVRPGARLGISWLGLTDAYWRGRVQRTHWEFGNTDRPRATMRKKTHTRGSFVVLVYRMRLCAASETRTRGRARSSRRRWMCSVTRRSLSSDIDCF